MANALIFQDFMISMVRITAALGMGWPITSARILEQAHQIKMVSQRTRHAVHVEVGINHSQATTTRPERQLIVEHGCGEEESEGTFIPV